MCGQLLGRGLSTILLVSFLLKIQQCPTIVFREFPGNKQRARIKERGIP